MKDDEIMKKVRVAKAKVAKKIGGKGFENYLSYFQAQEEKLEKQGFKFVAHHELTKEKVNKS